MESRQKARVPRYDFAASSRRNRYPYMEVVMLNRRATSVTRVCLLSAVCVLAWTIADVRYRFRVRTAPIPLQGITFSVVTAVGNLAPVQRVASSPSVGLSRSLGTPVAGFKPFLNYEAALDMVISGRWSEALERLG